ncbi:GNAT family N-acetyltransferase [Sphaerisporangium dianthi]|uniref:GNAT family N-acetyltransferase n=1 Tax=Sphaerisporangium dianthi TaxID=1436120 RepID=A0ABV9CBK3_9ACTN
MSEIVLRAKDELPQEWFNAICAIHDAVFLQPPFAWTSDTSRENAEDLCRLAKEPTFGVVVACHDRDLIGYAYGHRLPVDHGWWRAIAQPLPPEFTREWDGRTFTLTGLAVLPGQRGRSLGKRLIGRLLGSRTEERAVLSVQPAAVATQGFYRHLGWRLVGRNGPFPDITPPHWDVYVMDRLPRQEPAC